MNGYLKDVHHNENDTLRIAQVHLLQKYRTTATICRPTLIRLQQVERRKRDNQPTCVPVAVVQHKPTISLGVSRVAPNRIHWTTTRLLGSWIVRERDDVVQHHDLYLFEVEGGGVG